MASLYDRMRSAGLRREENSDGSYKVSNDTSRSTNTFGDAKNRENLLRQIAAERVQRQAAEQTRQANSLRIAQDYAKTQQDTLMNIAMGSVASGHNLGRYGQGNIDLYNRPQYKYPNGSTATVESMSFGTDEGEILVPTIDFDKQGNPIKLTDDQAIDRYYNTGEYLGKFKTIDEANAYADKLHRQQDRYYGTSKEDTPLNTSLQEQLANLPQAQIGNISYEDMLNMREPNVPLNPELAARSKANDRQKRMDASIRAAQQFGEEHPLVGAGLSVSSGLIGSALSPIETARAKLSGEETDINSPMYRMTRQGTAYREGTQQGVKNALERGGIAITDTEGNPTFAAKAADFGVGTGLSMVETIIRSTTMGPLAGAAQAGLSAGSQGFIEAKEKGFDDFHAVATGVAQGVAENFFEKYSLEGLEAFRNAPVDSLKQFLLNMAKQSVTEGSEEFFTDWANAASDYLINGGESELMQNYNAKRAGGMNDIEARFETFKDLLYTSCLSALGGAISGGILGGGAQYIEGRTNLRQGQDLIQNNQAFTENDLRESAEAIDVSPETYTDANGVVNEEVLGQAENTKDYLMRLAEQATSGDLTPMQQGAALTEIGKTVQMADEVQRNREENTSPQLNEGFIDDDTIAENEIAEQRQSAIQEMSENLGEAGQQTYVEMYGDGGPESVIEYNEGFRKLYDAARSADPDAVTEARQDPAVQKLTMQQQNAAVMSGTADARIELTERNNGNESGNRIEGRQAVVDGFVRSEGVQGTGVQGRTAQQQRAAQIRSDAADQRWSRTVKSSEVIDTGTDAAVTVLSDDYVKNNAELRKIADENNAAGIRTTFIVGNLTVSDKGYEFDVRGCEADDGKRIVVRTDHSVWTPEQINKHERFHAAVKKDRSILESARQKLISNHTQAELEKIVEDYADAYALTGKDADYIFEELCADIHAGMDIFNGKMEDYESEVEDAIRESSALTDAERGPPSYKYSAESVRTLAKAGAVYDAETNSVNDLTIRYSADTFQNSLYIQDRDAAVKDICEKLNVSKKKANAYIDAINSVSKRIVNNRYRYDYTDSGLSPFVSNVEYGGSFDFDTLCPKRRIFIGTFQAIQNALPNTALTRDEVLYIRKMMDEQGLEVPCGKCYVEGSRAAMGEFTKKFLELYKKYYPDNWQPNMAEANTPDGIEWIRLTHPECYEQYEYFWNHYGTLRPGDPNLFASQQKPKLFMAHSAYTDEILREFKDAVAIAEKNKNGGIRFQSFSDFEIIHAIDAMQAIMDMSVVGLAGQAYTKQPNFAEAYGNTGLKINLSIDAWGLDENGNLIFNDKEGMPAETAFALREKYSDTVGTICCVYDDAMLLAALKDPRIDFIIPFHRSQWKKSQYKAMGLPSTTKDYTYQQNEKWLEPSKHMHEYKTKNTSRMVRTKCMNYMPNEYWDFSKSGKENAEKYLEMCYKDGKRPKFYKFLDKTMVDGKAKFSLKADGSTDGYWKLLIDFKMYNNDGVGVPQQAVKPDFNMDEVNRMFDEYAGDHHSYPVAHGIVEQFVTEYKRNHPGAKYSRDIDVAANDKNNQDVVRQGSDKDVRYSTELFDKNVNEKLKVSMGTFFSGAGTVDFALRNIVKHQFAVEYDAKIAALYRDNNGDNIYVDDVRNVDIDQHKGKVEYFHASPVCKSYSNANNDQGEKPVDIDTAKATADAINTLQPKVVTVENVARYRNSEAIKIIEDALKKNGYTFDKNVYRASDFGGATIRERMFLRAVKDGVLPKIDTSKYTPMTWYEAVEDMIPDLTEVPMSNYMRARLEKSGIDPDNLTMPVFILGGEKSGKLTWAYADKPAPTILAKSTEAKILMPDGRILRATPNVLGRIQGLPKDFIQKEKEEKRGWLTDAYKAVGNGVPTQLTQGIVGPLLEENIIKQKSEKTGIKYSLDLVPAVKPSSDDWKSGFTTDQAMEVFPNLWNVAAEESETKNPTSVKVTLKSYQKIYDQLKSEGFNGTIMDASSGLGYGTEAGITDYGFDVEDIEPYPGERHEPTSRDYSKWNKTYDVVISNAVLNVLPQEQRDAMVAKIGEMLNPGGRAFVNVRSVNDVKAAKSKLALNEANGEYVITSTGSYQKGFSEKELVSYLEDALGDGYTVTGATKKYGSGSNVWAEIRKDGNIKYSSEPSKKYAPTFFSKMEREVESMKQDKIGAASVESYLKGKGVKDEEIKWSGIRTFLEGKKSVTKQELLDFSKANELQIGVQTLSGKGTKWRNYSLLGGDNYRELLFKMPDSNYSNKAMKTHWDNQKGVIAHARVQDFETKDGKVLFIDEIQSDWHNAGQKYGYGSNNLKTIADKYQKERQDYVKQELLKKHNKEDVNAYYDNEAISSLPFDKYMGLIEAERELSKKWAEQNTEKLRVMLDASLKSSSVVPDAPFRENYTDFVLKSLLRMAAEGDYNYLAWTTGKMQEDRWSSKYAEGYRIEYDQEIPKFLKKYGKQWKAGLVEVTLNDNKNALVETEADDEYMNDLRELFEIVRDFDTEIGMLAEGVGYLAEDTENAIEEGIIDPEYADRAMELARKLDDAYNNGIISSEYLTERLNAEYEEEDRQNAPIVDVPAIVVNDAMKESVLYAGQPMYSRDVLPNPEVLERAERDIRQLRASRNNEDVRRRNDVLAVLDREFDDALTDVKGSHVTQHQVSQIADKYTSGMSAEGKRDVKQSIKELYDLIGNATKTNARELIDAAAAIANKVLEGEEHYERNPQMQKLSKELKRTKFWISPELKKEIEYHFGSYTEFRRQYSKFMGMTLDRNRATSFVDQWYQGADRGWFNEEIINEAEQLLQIAEVAKYVAIGDKISDEYMGEDYEEVMYTMAQEILADYFKANGNEKYMQKINAVKDELKNEYQAKLEYIEDQYGMELAKAAKKVASAKNNLAYTEEQLTKQKEKFTLYKMDQRNKRYTKKMRDELWDRIRTLKKMKGNAQFNQERAEIFSRISAVRRGALSPSTIAKLQTIKADENSKSPLDPDYSVRHHRAALKQIQELDLKHVGDMTVDELGAYLNAVTELIHYQRMENRLFDEEKEKFVSTESRKYIDQQNHVEAINDKRKMRGFLEAYKINSLAPIRTMPLFDGYDPDGVMGEYAQKFFDGEMKAQDYMMGAEKSFAEWLDDEKYMSELTKPAVTVTNTKGQTATISKDMAIAMYLAGRDDGNKMHTESGGWLIPDEELYLKGKRKDAYNKARTFVMKERDYAQIADQLSDRDKKFAEAISKYFNEYSQKAINEVSRKLYGYDIANVKNYFPIAVGKNLITSDIDVYNDPTLESSGFTKERREGAVLPIYLDSVTNVLKRSINNVGRYYGLTTVLRDFNNIYNYTFFDKNRGRFASGKDSFSRAWRSAGQDYLENLMSDLNRGSREKPKDLLDYVYAGYGSAVLGANVRVMLSQASSYPMALTILHPDSLAKGLATANKKVDMDYIDSITPSMYMRRKGMTGTELGEMYSVRQRLKENPLVGKIVKSLDVLTSGIQKVDVWTTTHLVSACIAEMDKYYPGLKPGTAAYNKQLSSLIEQVNSRTQPSYGTMNRNEYAKRPGAGYKILTMFKTQTFNMYGEMVDAIGRDAACRRLYKEGKISKAYADDAKKKAAAAILAVLLSQTLFEGIKKLVNMSVYHDPGDSRDEYGDVTAVNTVLSIMKDTVKDIMGMAPGADKIVNDGAYFIGKLAGNKDRLYDIEAPGLGTINDIRTALDNETSAILKYAEDPTAANKKNLQKKSLQLIMRMGNLGYPLQNTYNTLNGVYSNIKNKPFNYDTGDSLFDLKDTGPSKEQNAKKGIKLFEQGDAAKGKVYLERSNESQVKTAMGASNQDDVVEYLKESDLSEKSQRILWGLAGYAPSSFDKKMKK